METTIRDIRVWYDSSIRDKSKREYRIYVHTTDGREGYYYLTGNKWHPAKSTEGKLTEAEWSQAREIGYDGKWHTLYENQIHPVERVANSHNSTVRHHRCPDCGGYDCGSNCNANPSENVTRGDGLEHARWETEENLSGLGL